jgi:SpoVK/Ycf46/Vps4 family AAA+-type ATPase
MTIDPETLGNARIVLFHGPPGTGKTTAIRALADAWQHWCTMTYVIDPEEMFNRAGYLMTVLLDPNDKPWRLVVIEDAEEFLTPNAKASVGQSVARLLNIGDGMIGQGCRVLVLMTTNVPIVKLHDAITRPGRCAANIEVPRLTAGEANAWSNGLVRKESTLAELYEATGTHRIGDGIQSQSNGLYL